MKKRIMAVLVFYCVSACSSRVGTAIATSSPPDSIVLQRTACFGTCPVYRLSVTKLGRVAFTDDAIDTTDAISPKSFGRLYEELHAAGLASLPDTIQQREDYCMPVATDFPTVILTVFAGEKKKTVNDYHGCFGTTDSTKGVLRRLRLLENQVDSVARAARWIKPSRRR